MFDELPGLSTALATFAASGAGSTQSQGHIRDLHRHIAVRLVVEGGFHPDLIVPRPPIQVVTGARRGRLPLLAFDPAAGKWGEQTILGGLKTKDVDVVVSSRETGPCIAISVKGTLNAFRNLTNRMEEAAGDCTNLHMAYPALVYGFLHVLRANRPREGWTRNDVAMGDDGEMIDTIVRYHEAMSRLTGRKDIRNDVSRYEAVSIALVEGATAATGPVYGLFPLPDSPLRIETFFSRIYECYDLRFVYAAAALRKVTQRLEWSSESPLFTALPDLGFNPRVGVE